MHYACPKFFLYNLYANKVDTLQITVTELIKVTIDGARTHNHCMDAVYIRRS